MANEDHFKQAVVTTLAKRAANICSNPDCRTVTSGPTDAPMGSINIGEAAHIFDVLFIAAPIDVGRAAREGA